MTDHSDATTAEGEALRRMADLAAGFADFAREMAGQVPVPSGLRQVGWYVVDDDLLISLEEEEDFGYCYRELRPVFVETQVDSGERPARWT